MAFVARPSIQHFEVPRPLHRVADEYFDWVDEHIPAVRVHRQRDRVDMHLFGSRRPAIALRGTDGGENYAVTGGFLVADPAAGEFRFEQPSPGEVRIVLRGFTPRLPKLVYLLTHSLVHEYVMWAFRRHMEVPLIEENGR